MEYVNQEIKKISIIIPIYNVAPYLEQCLESVQKQTYSNLEVILVNDGSTDTSSQICHDFILRDSRFRYIEQVNKGVSAARNTGLRKASGDYITFIDSDDYVDENHIEVLYQTLLEEEAEIAVSSYKIQNHEGKVFLLSPSKQQSKWLDFTRVNRDDFLVKFPRLFQINQSFHCAVSKLFSRKLVEGLFFDETLEYGEDLDFYFRLYLRVHSIAFSNIPTYMYRIHETNITKNQTEKHIEDELKVHQTIYQVANNLQLATLYYYKNFEMLLRYKVIGKFEDDKFKSYIQFLEEMKEKIIYPNEMISIVVSISNAAPYLRFCLDRLVEQSYSNFEVLLINENSSDESEVICKEYTNSDHRFCYIQLNDKKLSAKNIGVSKSNGEFITFIDGNDFVQVNYLQELYRVALQQDSEIVVGSYMEFDQKKNVYRIHEFETYETHYQGAQLIKALPTLEKEYLTFQTSWGILFHRRLFERVQFMNNREVEDSWTNYKLFMESEKSSYIRKNLYVVRTNYIKGEKKITESYLESTLEALLMRYAIYHATGLDEGFEKEQLMQHLNELIKKAGEHHLQNKEIFKRYQELVYLLQHQF